VEFVPFSLSVVELCLEEIVTRLSRLFEVGAAREQLIANSLRRSLQSSPAALESALTRIESARNPAVDGFAPVASSPDEEQTENDAGGALNLDLAAKAGALASLILEAMDVAGYDSKLEDLTILLALIAAPDHPHPRICILTDYLSTLMYLDAAFETHGTNFQILHTGMNTEEQDGTLNRFVSDGMILGATLAVISDDAAMAEVTDLIFYDLPGSPTALKEVLAAFDGLGRKTQLTVHVLIASNGVESAATSSLELLCCGSL
jgi:hypothetical protein